MDMLEGNQHFTNGYSLSQTFGFYIPGYFGYAISNRFFNDYFSLAHFFISFLLCALASLIVSVFSGLDFRAAFFCNA
jgi:uncharacterized membrane protein YcaP (DUF421 family)